MANVILDLWGVVADLLLVEIRFRDRVTNLLSTRFGGSVDSWRKGFDEAMRWHARKLRRPRFRRVGDFLAFVNGVEAERLVRTFRGAGVTPPKDPLALVQSLDLEILPEIDSDYEDVRPAVEEVRRLGHRTFVSSEDSDAATRAVLEGSGLLSLFDEVISGESQNAAKNDLEYWQPIPAPLRNLPGASFVVDDREVNLRAAAAAGFRCILVDRHSGDSRKAPSFVESTMPDLSALPGKLAGAARDS